DDRGRSAHDQTSGTIVQDVAIKSTVQHLAGGTSMSIVSAALSAFRKSRLITAFLAVAAFATISLDSARAEYPDHHHRLFPGRRRHRPRGANDPCATRLGTWPAGDHRKPWWCRWIDRHR